ncbi:4228_t:CDS:2, partial [Entrophospora sp. SA101]
MCPSDWFAYIKRDSDEGIGEKAAEIAEIMSLYRCCDFQKDPMLSEKQLAVSLLGVFYGVFSSITTALHAIVIKKSLVITKENTMDLVYYNNLLSFVCFIPLILLTGEERQIYQMSFDSLHTFLIGIVITGFFGFLINIAGFLQIKVTSPMSHMISSAFRGVIQTVLGATIFSDILTIGRVIKFEPYTTLQSSIVKARYSGSRYTIKNLNQKFIKYVQDNAKQLMLD